jgi:hypothetical protein
MVLVRVRVRVRARWALSDHHRQPTVSRPSVEREFIFNFELHETEREH